jgi:hypothetical protein
MIPISEEVAAAKPARPDSAGMKAFDFLRHSVSDCLEAKEFRKIDVEVVSQTLWAGIHGITSLLITHGDTFPWAGKENVIHAMVDTLLLGTARAGE